MSGATDQKAWDTARAAAALRGIELVRSDPRDGPVRVVALRGRQAVLVTNADDLEALWVGAARALDLTRMT